MHHNLNHQCHYLTLTETLADLCPDVRGANQYVAGLSADSRQIAPGYIFFAYPGVDHDGRDYICEAVDRGAIAVVYESSKPYPMHLQAALDYAKQHGVLLVPVTDCQAIVGVVAARFYQNPSAQMSVVGVTGTNGKTSITMILAQALDYLGCDVGLIGTLGWGRPGRLNASTLTTPDPISLQSYCAQLRDDGVQTIIFEVSSHALSQGRINGLNVDTAVFTNLTRDHMDYYSTPEAYGAAKRRLFKHPGLRNAVLNYDDPLSKTILQDLDGAVNTMGVSEQAPSDITSCCYPQDIEVDAHGVSFVAYTPWGRQVIRSKLQGAFQVYNLMQSLVVLVELGVSFSDACRALSAVKSIPGRAECIGEPGQPKVIVDYAHTPDALMAILNHAQKMTNGRVWCVFGCGGERDQGKRSQMGQIAERFSDEVVLTDDNPRNENPTAIINDICQGILCPWAITIEHDRCAAIQYAIANAAADDVVVIAGKGHEQVQVVAGTYLSHSDIEHAQSRLSVWLQPLSKVA